MTRPMTTKSCLAFALATIGMLVAATPSPAQWTPAGTLGIPKHPYSFLAATPKGDLLAATFNNNAAGDPPKEMPALLIRNPDTKPEAVVLCAESFESARGYGGLACGPDGSFYVSGDTGKDDTCFVKKFLPTGQPDTTFGRNGEIRPKKRTLGMDMIGDSLLVAVNWGKIDVMNAKTGVLTGQITPGPSSLFLRDVAIDPKSMRVFGVAKGSVVTWGGSGAAPWTPGVYQFRKLTPEVGELRSGEGISMDPINRTVLITPIPGNKLLEIYGSGRVVTSVVSSAAPNAHLADSSMSFDGTRIYVSEMLARQIHVLRRTLKEGANNTPAAAGVVAAAPEVPGAAPAAKVTWNPSYEAIVKQARSEGKPMVVYFRNARVPKALSFEKETLLTDGFNRRAEGFVCVFEDVAKSGLIAYRFGVTRVPAIYILDKDGNTVLETQFNINRDQLFATMEKLTAKKP